MPHSRREKSFRFPRFASLRALVSSLVSVHIRARERPYVGLRTSIFRLVSANIRRRRGLRASCFDKGIGESILYKVGTFRLRYVTVKIVLRLQCGRKRKIFSCFILCYKTYGRKLLFLYFSVYQTIVLFWSLSLRNKCKYVTFKKQQ